MDVRICQCFGRGTAAVAAGALPVGRGARDRLLELRERRGSRAAAQPSLERAQFGSSCVDEPGDVRDQLVGDVECGGGMRNRQDPRSSV